MKRLQKTGTALLLLLAMLAGGCGPKTPEVIPETPTGITEAEPREVMEEVKAEAIPDTTNDNYRAFYQIFIGSFSDSDGDGTGDLRGIINRMDYLNDGNVVSTDSLGVQGIWLSPIFASPSYHKYDAADYYRIDDKFGTEADLAELIALCHERNVKVILDLAINHSSRLNEWFIKFSEAHANGDTTDPYYDAYSWAPLDARTPGLAYSAIPGAKLEYYECNFSTDMPELNFDNEEVRKQMLDVAKYYLDLGVDGFRFDAVKYIYYNDTERSVDFWNWYIGELKAYKPDIYCVGECWSGDTETLKYIEALNCFNFQMSQAEGQIANAAKGNGIDIYTRYVERYQNQVQTANPEDGMPMPFLANHDMDRSAGYMTVASRMAHMAANLYLLSPGSPFIYYGEEIGLKGSRGGANTDANRRLAMNWGDEDTVKDPEGTTYEKKKQTNGTVAEQLANPESLFHHYSKVLTIRNTYPEIPRGQYKALTYGEDNFGGFLITYEGEQTILLHNTSSMGEIVIDLASCPDFPVKEWAINEVIGNGEATLEGSVLTLAPTNSVLIK